VNKSRIFGMEGSRISDKRASEKEA